MMWPETPHHIHQHDCEWTFLGGTIPVKSGQQLDEKKKQSHILVSVVLTSWSTCSITGYKPHWWFTKTPSRGRIKTLMLGSRNSIWRGWMVLLRFKMWTNNPKPTPVVFRAEPFRLIWFESCVFMDQAWGSWKCKATLTNLVQFHSWRDTGGVRFLLKASDLVSFGSCSAREALWYWFYVIYCMHALLHL